MISMHRNMYKRRKLRDELELRQRNLIWPDVLRNTARVDQFLWKGSPSPTRIQRVGLWIFALFYLGAAASFIAIGFYSRAYVMVALGLLAAGFGARTLRNAFRIQRR